MFSLLVCVRGVGSQLGKFLTAQGRTANKAAINVRLGDDLRDGVSLDGTAVKNADAGSNFLASKFLD